MHITTQPSLVTDDPQLAADVRLVGPMQDVGFEDSQWLVERGRQFIQVSEVIYRALERADGRHSVREIAQYVTDSTDWLVDESTLRVLIDAKLVPLRLVESDSTSTAPAESGRASASPLDVNMRMLMVPERLVGALVEPLQRLFAMPWLLALLAASAAAHVWMYAVHGVRGTVAEVLYTPGALLAVFGIIVAAGFVHELGHAAALRYGGGRVRGIGAGLYLIFPAFFTDATDAYRLGRAARVRIDLGGIYFHLLCALVLILTAAWTHWDLLLFAAFLLNIEAMRQFIPFVRLDGYWTIADLTGIPDFFSQMGPFLRSLLPVRATRGLASSSLPPLRPVARTVFAIYTFAVVPVLAYLMIAMVVRLPGFLNTTRDALLVQAHALTGGGPLLTSVLAVTQMFFLATPVVGTVYILSTIGWSIAAPIGRWLPPPARRFGGALCVVTGSLALLVWFNAGTGAATAPAQADASRRAATLLGDVRQAVASTDTLEADLDGQVGADHFTGTLLLKRPNFARVRIHGSEGLGDFLVVSDGQALFVYFPEDNYYTRVAARPDGANIDGFVVDQVRQFFNPQSIASTPSGGSTEYVGARRIEDVDGDVIAVRGGPDSTPAFYFVARDDRVVRRIARGTAIDGPAGDASWVQLRNVRRNSAAVSRDEFAWSVPPGATTLQLPFVLDLPGKTKRTVDASAPQMR